MWFSYNYLKQKALKKIWKKKAKRENFEWERANFVLERERLLTYFEFSWVFINNQNYRPWIVEWLLVDRPCVPIFQWEPTSWPLTESSGWLSLYLSLRVP